MRSLAGWYLVAEKIPRNGQDRLLSHIQIVYLEWASIVNLGLSLAVFPAARVNVGGNFWVKTRSNANGSWERRGWPRRADEQIILNFQSFFREMQNNLQTQRHFSYGSLNVQIMVTANWVKRSSAKASLQELLSTFEQDDIITEAHRGERWYSSVLDDLTKSCRCLMKTIYLIYYLYLYIFSSHPTLLLSSLRCAWCPAWRSLESLR